MQAFFEQYAHYLCRRRVIEDDDTIGVAARLKRVDEWITLLQEEAVIPLVDDVRHVTLINNPAFTAQASRDFDRNLVIVAVWPATFAVMVEDSVSGTDPDGLVFSDLQRSFSGICE